MRRKAIIFAILASFGMLKAQVGYWPNDTSGKDHSLYAIKNITLQKDAKTQISDAVLVFKEGRVLSAGKVAIPEGAVVIDAKGAYVYPSFVDPYAQLGVEKKTQSSKSRGSMYLPSDPTFAAYNDAVKADTKASEHFTGSASDYKAYLAQGFGSALSFNEDGIVRGSAALIALGEGEASDKILKEEAALMLSFSKGSSKQAYPTSLVGSIALLRQLYLDAKWYENLSEKKELNGNLEAFNRLKKLPTILETSDKWDVLRGDKIGDEAGYQFVFLGSGNEYQRADEIKSTGGVMILPLEYPKAYQIKDPLDVELLDVAELKHWELAPYNAVFLSEKKVPMAFTLQGLKDKNSFLSKLRDLHEKGMSKEAILSSLTTVPASIFQMKNLGTLEAGSVASFFMSSGDLFEKDSEIFDHYVQGKRFVVTERPSEDIRGNYKLYVNGQPYDLELSGKQSKVEAQVKNDTKKGKAKINLSDYKVALELQLPGDSLENYRVFYPINEHKNFSGMALNKSGSSVPFRVVYEKPFTAEKKAAAKEAQPIGKIWYPFAAFGEESLPTQKDYLIKGATVWTNTEEGIKENYDVLVSKGKIARIGANLSSSGAQVIDGSGMHLTSGIIDEHTHVGISRGVNEAGSNNSGEVRMSDAVNPDDVNFYRQLAGGVTIAQQLHGSANPVGGQSSLVKFRWGENAEGLAYKGASPFIKFALGENVKQSNWGNNPNRFPQSRGGVEQAFDFWFTRAKEYETEKKQNKNFRRDLRLETMLEILNQQRYITCHSYVQSEINMLMQLADRFDFKVQTFTHILEGYKVADKMKAHGVNASTFSDWWAYKEEVREAIPQNAALLLSAGVNTAINSDDAEMARRLNQEAAKSVKYGGVSQEEAWKMVTLNPAKMLKIDDKVGSIAVGKDADLVLWNANPLSVYASVDKTIVDGILYFDAKSQGLKDQRVKDEKNRIVQKMLFAPEQKSGGARPVSTPATVLYHCDTLEEHEEHNH